MSNQDQWHVQKVRFKSGWRQIGDVAEVDIRRNNLLILLTVNRVTDTHYIEKDWKIPGGTSATEVLIELKSGSLKKPITTWFTDRAKILEELKANVAQNHWNRGTVTSEHTYAALALLYQLFVAENVKDVISELQRHMNTPTREAAAMRVKTIRSKHFLTSPSRGVTQGRATELSQQLFPTTANWVNTYY